ncbi:MAG: glycosyltransferase family 4 protein [Myxococcaceae bacterium]
MAVHQLLPSFGPADLVFDFALELRRFVRRSGVDGEVLAETASTGVARPLKELDPRAGDWVLYHQLRASKASNLLLHTPARRALLAHPLKDLSDRAAHAERAALAGHVELALAFDVKTVEELRSLGYAQVERVAPFVDLDRYQVSARPRGLTVVTLGASDAERGKTSARIQEEDALRAELLRLDPRSKVVALPATGRIPLLQRAAVCVCFAEQPFSPLELLEVMALEVPVLAFAVPSAEAALGDAGVRFSQKHYAILAELCRELGTAGPLREKVIEGQNQRLQQLAPWPRWGELLELERPQRPRPRTRRKLGLVVQRYGEAVTGGAEKHARMVAEHLAPHVDVTVLTTCALDHFTWANVLPAGEEETALGVRVRRFATAQPRQMRPFNALSRQLFNRATRRAEEERWTFEQGPYAPGLRRHIVDAQGDYDAFLFFTYLYSTTVDVLPLVANRSLLVPTAHDEPPLAFEVYRDVFQTPHALICNTPEEVALIEGRFPNTARPRVVGVGVDAPTPQPERFARTFGVHRPYLLYVGRLEAGKGIPEALELHQQLFASTPDAPDFLLAGSGELQPKGRGVRALGRISEEEKWDAMAGAAAVVVPSRYESLSLLALEAFAVGTPVIANEASDVLKGQVQRSQGGATYSDEESFAEAVQRVREQRSTLSKNAKAFARKHRWPVVVDAYLEEIERIVKERR